MSLTGKTALVTGASRGIGAAIARRLAADGARVVITARSEAQLTELAGEIDGVALPLDLGDRKATDHALERLKADVGRVDILVNNAGISDAAPIERTNDVQWDRILEIDLTAPLRLCRELVPGMVEAGWGRVVNLASNAGLSGYSYTHAYCAAKHGLIGLTRSMAHELARRGITVNAVCPGWVETDMLKEAVERIMRTTGRDEAAARKVLLSMSPAARAVTPAEVAHVVAMLCDEGARGINGQAIPVDGGQIMK
ncbi:MAG: 3-hydroxybutyrate dehydrogenase [Myxococcota bacterium]|jgi:3-hydroxybutyrate dehydrogenase